METQIEAPVTKYAIPDGNYHLVGVNADDNEMWRHEVNHMELMAMIHNSGKPVLWQPFTTSNKIGKLSYKDHHVIYLPASWIKKTRVRLDIDG